MSVIAKMLAERAEREETRATPSVLPLPPRPGTKDWREVKINDTVYIGKDDKRWAVVDLLMATTKAGNEVPYMRVVPLSGKSGTVGVVISEGMYGSSVTPMRFDTPIFYGKSADKLYKDYVSAMEKYGRGDQIAPRATATDKPTEPDAPPPPSDTATAEEADVSITHSVRNGTRMDWKGGKSNPQFDQLRKIARQGGFVWAPQQGTWMRTNSIGLVETRAPVAWMVASLHDLGLRVFLDLEVGETETAVARKQEYLRERAAGKAERASRKLASALAALGQAKSRQEREVATQEIEGFFPTPPDVAEDAVRYLEVIPGMRVLEPSAGSGNLVEALRRVGVDNAYAFEIDTRLRNKLVEDGVRVIGADVMDRSFHPGTAFDRIVMNPPYEKGLSIDHTRHVYPWLRPGGVLVAILPESILYREDRKHQDFRAWLDALDADIHDVERQAFGRASSIKTRIVVVRKPSDEAFVQGDPVSIHRMSLADSTALDAKNRKRQAEADEHERDARFIRGIEQRMRDSSGRSTDPTKGEMAEYRAVKAKQAARFAADRAKRIEASARRVDEVSVSKGGRTAVSKPRYYGPSQSSDWLQEVAKATARLKKPTGAKKVERGYRGKADINFQLEWDRPDTSRTIMGGHLPLRRSVELKQDGTIRIDPPRAYASDRAPRATGQAPVGDVEGTLVAIADLVLSTL